MDYLLLFGGQALIAGIVVYCAKLVVETAMAKAMAEHKSLLDHSNVKRQKAALVAELLAEWTSPDPDYTRLNKLTWEATMWLPETEARYLSNLLAHHENHNIREMIAKSRSVIQGGRRDIEAAEVNFFRRPGVAQPSQPPVPNEPAESKAL